MVTVFIMKIQSDLYGDIELTYMRKFDPIRRMIISRDSGLLNEYFSIVKGQLIDLYYFATIGPMENDEPETYPVLDNETGDVLWVIESEIKNYKSGMVDIPVA